MAGWPIRGHRLGFAAFAAGVAVVPLLLPNEYYLTVLIIAGFHTILTLGLNLLMGYAGQISLGHAAFYGIAAYATGILTARFHWPVPAGILAGITLVLAVAAGIAVPTLRLRGHYLAMGTLGFGIIVYIILNETRTPAGRPASRASRNSASRASRSRRTLPSTTSSGARSSSSSCWLRTWCGRAWGARCGPFTRAKPPRRFWASTRSGTRSVCSS
jgi:ABC-type branched-subunit amino acid transport system permease subunit